MRISLPDGLRALKPMPSFIVSNSNFSKGFPFYVLIPFTPVVGILHTALDSPSGWPLYRSPNYKLCGCSVSRNTLQHKLEDISSTDKGSLFRKVLETYLDWFKNTSLAVLGQAPSARPEGGCKTSDQKSAGI